jgi:transposase InsO family protein
LLDVANEPRFAAVPPARIVPMLADEGVYLGSESSFTRVLRAHGQTAHRGRAKAPHAVRPPTTHLATAVRQVWCWDMTYLPATVMGRWFHLYLILDLYSRKIVGWEVHDRDHSDHAVHLLKRTALAEGIAALPVKPVLHGDNGSTLKATTVLSMLNWLGVKPSYSRPRVSDDNAYAESLFRTAKYRPEFPAKGFSNLDAARQWAAGFVHWYNVEHRHSAIRGKITPSWLPDTTSTQKPVISLRLGGQAKHGTGRPWVRSLSTPNATPSSEPIRTTTLFSSWLHE